MTVKRFFLIAAMLCPTALAAQNDEFRAAYDSFKNQARREYEDFRQKANAEYAEWVKKAWEEHKRLPVILKPKDDKVKPVVIKDEDKNRTIEDRPVVIEEKLYPQIRSWIDSKSHAEAVNIVCHWIQTAFKYEYDDKVWGGDRAFFADETLYYPYCDCEDRSILLTRIVRDVLGLKCALVFYPGHLATAIAVGEDAKGDFLRISGTKFLVCDPTYIGAPIGMTMPDMDNKTAKAIVLN